ncbi:MAG: UvrD-helicase domain-containing protein [Bacteroidales bacterium]|nr:UvrD-helicase domain-containing protein [Bacteroidales bacterium]
MTFIVYQSSAGSGKTFTLVKAYLLLVLKSPMLYRNILGVTFTNKAANEMKQRVVAALSRLANSKVEGASASTDALISQLSLESGLEPVIIRERAALVLTAILHHYSDFSISTIDAFTHRLVRAFTRDLGLPYLFEVEIAENTITLQAVDKLLARVGYDAFITRAIVDFMFYRMDEGSGWMVAGELVKFAGKLQDQEDPELIDRLTAFDEATYLEAIKVMQSQILIFEQNMKALAEASLATLAQNGIAFEDITGKSTGIPGFYKKLLNNEIAGAYELKSWPRFLELDDWSNAKALPAQKAAIGSAMPRLKDLLHKIARQFESPFETYNLYRLILPNVFPMALLGEIQRGIQEVLAEQNLVHISEFNKRISKLVSGVSAPYLYERFGEKYQHYLIDEFQDTSVLQWHNFLPLIDNALAQGKMNLVVGDGKQAIYRFRSGEVEQFLMLPSIFKAEQNAILFGYEQSLKQHYEPRNLETNYRSAAAIVDFNNRFFSFAKNFLSEAYQEVYAHVTQKSIRNTSGLVQVEFLQPADGELKEKTMLDRIGGLIGECLNDGFSLKDIAILCRASEHGIQTARYLNQQQIPVISAESLLVGSSPQVKTLLACLKLMDKHDNKIAFTEFVYFLEQSIPTAGLNWMTRLELMARQKSPDFMTVLHEMLEPDDNEALLQHVFQHNLYDLAELLIRKLGFVSNGDAYLQFFLEIVHEFQIKQRGSLSDFLQFWDDSAYKTSVRVPDQTDAVRVMTIHKAKGLEFPVVIYAFANFDASKPTKKDFWVNLSEVQPGDLTVGLAKNTASLKYSRFARLHEQEKEKTQLDLMNIIYVAMTRPSERLYILTKHEEKEKEKFDLNYFLSAYIKDQGLWQPDELVYRFGEAGADLQKRKVAEEVHDESFHFISSGWTDRLLVVPEQGLLSIGKEAAARLKGKLIHRMLADLVINSDLDAVLGKYRQQGFVNVQEISMLKPVFQQILSHDLLAPCFRPGTKVYIERELCWNGKQLIRPDRVSELEDRVILVDYKTGQADQHHLAQMRNYREALTGIFKKPIHAYLVYLDHEIELIAC